jgi:RecA-family ATPase
LSDYIIDGLVPKHEVHLLAGVSGSGKTTWLFHTLLDWQMGINVLGFKSNPVPWCYVSADRSLASAYRTMAAMGIPAGSFPMLSAHGADKKDWGKIIDTLAGMDEGIELAVIEGFASLLGGTGNATHREVSNFIHKVCEDCAPSKRFPNGLTVIGVMESPKSKEHEKYSLPRQRVSGVATWGHMADCIFLVEHANVQKRGDPHRTLFVCPRIGKDLEFAGSFKANGHLTFP